MSYSFFFFFYFIFFILCSSSFTLFFILCLLLYTSLLLCLFLLFFHCVLFIYSFFHCVLFYFPFILFNLCSSSFTFFLLFSLYPPFFHIILFILFSSSFMDLFHCVLFFLLYLSYFFHSVRLLSFCASSFLLRIFFCEHPVGVAVGTSARTTTRLPTLPWQVLSHLPHQTEARESSTSYIGNQGTILLHYNVCTYVCRLQAQIRISLTHLYNLDTILLSLHM